MKRACGVLMHVSSLPSDYGIGDFGDSAYAFVDWLVKQGQSYWQMLPLNHCGYGNSPYNPLSSFLGNGLLISPLMLYRDGLLSVADLQAARVPKQSHVDFERTISFKEALLSKAAHKWLENNSIDESILASGTYQKQALCFALLMGIYQHSRWYEWDKEHRKYSVELFEQLWKVSKEQLRILAVIQKFFDEQYQLLMSYCHAKGIQIIGDIPLYVAYESSDIWANQEIFALSAEGAKVMVSGVPPDAFSDEGQLWGNPVYKWEEMQKNAYDWFLHRIGWALKHYDYLRLDHFIGYVNFWQVPSDCENAVHGEWVKALAEDFFGVLCERFGAQSFIAEDLGILTEEVAHIRDSFGFPGMLVLHFCFDEKPLHSTKFPQHKVLYTGTHDNNTSLGWWDEYMANNPHAMSNYLQSMELSDIAHEGNCLPSLIEFAYASTCDTVIIPLQDVLGLGSVARMNVPGVALGNWEWMLSDLCVLEHPEVPLNELACRYLRIKSTSLNVL